MSQEAREPAWKTTACVLVVEQPPYTAGYASCQTCRSIVDLVNWESLNQFIMMADGLCVSTDEIVPLPNMITTEQAREMRAELGNLGSDV